MQNFHPNLIRLLVFDLDSLTANFDQESWDNFRQFLLILDDRDFETLLISGSIEASEWESFAKLSVLHSTAENAFQNNPALSAKDVFWFSEQPELQKKISRISQNFAGSDGCTTQNGGLQYQHLHDMLQIFHPSRISAADLSANLFKLKQHSQQVPLMLGIGGPDECGHSFFVGELTDALEDQELLVSIIDLSQVLGTEFQKKLYQQINHLPHSGVLKKFETGLSKKFYDPTARGSKFISKMLLNLFRSISYALSRFFLLRK